MPWTLRNPPPPAKNWSLQRKRACVDAANAALRDSGDEWLAVKVCIAAANMVTDRTRSMAEPQARERARIKRASAKARREAGRIDAEARAELLRIYRRARDEIEAHIAEAGAADGRLQLQDLARLRAQIGERIDDLTGASGAILGDAIQAAANAGVAPMVGTVSTDLVQVADEAARFVRSFMAEDGLQLSDRLWRIDRQARELVTGAVEQAVIQGHSASEAAQEFLARGEPVPPELARKQGEADAHKTARIAGGKLMTGEGSAYDNALRVMRTEINRAHGEAYQTGALEHPDAIGTRFLLSPAHPRRDVCDMHASVNRYGLGPGVYPPGRNPWPAHPNTLSYVEVVFDDEVSTEDRAGKETRIDWLEGQSRGMREAVLGSKKKADAFEAGILRENQINTPWRVLKKRYERQGVDVEAMA